MDTKKKNGRTTPCSDNGAVDVHVDSNGYASNGDPGSTETPVGKLVAPVEDIVLTEREQEAIELSDEELDLVAGGLTRPLIVNGLLEATHLFRREPSRNGTH